MSGKKKVVQLQLVLIINIYLGDNLQIIENDRNIISFNDIYTGCLKMISTKAICNCAVKLNSVKLQTSFIGTQKITRRTTTSERYEFLQVIASFR